MFLRHFLRKPLRNASVTPSSRAAARAMLAGISWDAIHTVLELGPGTGPFTREVLRRCRPGTRVLLIELETRFVDILRHSFGDRIEVVHGSASDMDRFLAERGIGHADLILSSLPFLPESVRLPIHRSILRQTRAGAVFRFFTYMPGAMRSHYRDLPIRRIGFTPWNLPPMWIYGIN